MARTQTFADKVAKQRSKSQHHKIVVKLVESRKTEKGSWKFLERLIKVDSLDDLDKILN